MPMTEPEMYGGGDVENTCCCYCCDEAGNLKSREDVREGMTNFYMRHQGKSREEAEKFVDETMARMPAWKA
jgi:hypothetical protein